jgi:hypothetical protein
VDEHRQRWQRQQARELERAQEEEIGSGHTSRRKGPAGAGG